MSGKATAIKLLKEKWLSIVQSVKEKGEKGIGGPSTVTPGRPFGEGEMGCVLRLQLGKWCPHDQALCRWGKSALGMFIEGVRGRLVDRMGRRTLGNGGICGPGIGIGSIVRS